MTPAPVLALLLALAAVAIATVAGWVLAALAGSLLQRVDIVSAPVRASLLAQIRLLPMMLPLVVVPAQIAGFVRFEGTAPESAGPLLIGAACLGLFLLVDALWSGMKAAHHTRAILSQWRATAAPFRVPTWPRNAWLIRRRFPVVAVVGIVRPELFVDRRVADSCTAEELAAIAAHEAAHVAARDNLRRLLFSLTPGARLASSIGAPLEDQWTAAAELAADTDARRNSDPLDLASALIKVGRLTSRATPEAMPASAFIGSHDLESRVRRLLDPPVRSTRITAGWLPAGVLVTVAILLQTSPALSGLHELFEMLVRK
jgi:Zn-dependent protease with chaperone function